MAKLIENRPVSCRACSYGPVYGKEDISKTSQGTLLEVRWTCPRCGSLVRVDEEYIDEAGK